MTGIHDFAIPFLVLAYRYSVFDNVLIVVWVQNVLVSVKDIS